MKPTTRIVRFGLLLAGALLAACATQPATPASTPTQAVTPVAIPADGTADVKGATTKIDLARSDTQGAVEFLVTPLNLSANGATLDFDVSMDTHSVDLAWDLAGQSELTTDTGLAVRGRSWPVGTGHHYEGTLSFPATTAEGQTLLDGAASLTLTIRGTDVPARSFIWELDR